ncbi:cysteine desulfurase family protein [Phycicoccus sp. Soil748]|uniref:cysteine desulfurase family protein n=1 Tax=Phycicoccus sp. Soil748 TaxID=1736397 RepID=UPI0009E7F374|nr:cysteine desulfurase family protein [Phycicoccus sp. Soil748]
MPAYLDHAATTPMLPSAAAAMTEQLAVTGNASSLHTSGRLARRVVEESRERIARALGARPSEVVFTSGGTESDNLAVAGTWTARRDADPARIRIIASAIEHHAVLDCVDHLVSHEGAKVTWVEPDPAGVVTVDAVRAAIDEDPGSVALVTVMWANNEVGTIQPVAQLAALAHEHGVPFHSDAVQAAGHVPVDFAGSGLDLMTVTGHKVGGPLGVGALVVKRDAVLVPQTFGGGQERQVRSGTLDVPAIRAFAVALEESVRALDTETPRLVALRDRIVTSAVDMGYDISVTGAWEPGDAVRRLPGNAHLLVPGCEGDSLLYLLDAAGVECSTGSACQAGVPQPSHVLLAMGLPESSARGALRLTLGHTSTDADVDALLAALPAAVERARRASGAS